MPLTRTASHGAWPAAPRRARRYGRWRAGREQAARTEQYTYQSKFYAPTQGVANNPQGEGLWFDANEALAAFKDTEFKDTEFNSVCVGLWCAAGMRRSPSR